MVKKLLIGSALLCLAASASAANFEPAGGDTWDFYAYGNSSAIASIFTGLSMIVKSDTFRSLCIALALAGFAISGAVGLLGQNPKKFFGYIIGIILLVYAIFAVKMDIYIKEMVHTPGSPPTGVMVNDVPGAVGFPMVVISTVGTKLTDLMKTFMTTPSGTMSPGSLPFGAGLGIASDMANVRIANPYLQKNFNEWAQACFTPRLVSGEVNYAALADSPDVLASVKTTLAATSESQFFQMTYLNGRTDVPEAGSGETTSASITNYNGVVSCKEGFDQLEKQFSIAVDAGVKGIARKVSPQLLANASLAGDSVRLIAQQAAGSAMGDATSLATQGAVIDLLNKTSAYQAVALNNNPAMLALNTNNALRSQKTGWYTASVLFRDMGGYFYAILQVFLIGITPIVAALMFVPGMGAKLGGSYIKACVWLASWWPSLQIVNYIMELYYQANMTGTVGAAGGLTMANVGLVSQFNDNMVIAAGFMATLVPTVMWGIIQGTGMALTSVLDRASGASYASAAAQDAAAGNFRAGNVGMNSFSANKFDQSITWASGSKAAETFFGGGGSLVSNNRGGEATSQHGGNVTMSANEEYARARQEAIANQQVAQNTWQQTNSAVAKESISQLSSLMQQATVTSEGNVVFQNQKSLDQAKTYAGVLTESYNEAKSQGDTRTWEQYIKAEAGVEVNLNPLKNGASFSLAGGTSAKDAEQSSFKIEQTEGNQMQITDSKGAKIVNSEALSTTDKNAVASGAVSSQTYTATDEYNEMMAASKAYTEARQQTQTATDQYKASVQTSVPLAVNPSDVGGLAAPAMVAAAGAQQTTDNLNVKPIDTQEAENLQGMPVVPDGNFGANIVAGAETRIANTGAAVEAQSGEAQAKVKTANAESIREDLRVGNEKNKEVIERFTAGFDAFEYSSNTPPGLMTPEAYQREKLAAYVNSDEGAKILGGASNFMVNDQALQLEGAMVSRDGKDFDVVYRTGSNENDSQYYTIDKDGALRKLDVDMPADSDDAKRNGVAVGGYQIASFAADSGAVGADRSPDRVVNTYGNSVANEQSAGPFEDGYNYVTDTIGKAIIRGGDDYVMDNVNPSNRYDRNYTSIDATGVVGGGGQSIEDLAALTQTGVDRNNTAMPGQVSPVDVQQQQAYDAMVADLANRQSWNVVPDGLALEPNMDIKTTAENQMDNQDAVGVIASLQYSNRF